MKNLKYIALLLVCLFSFSCSETTVLESPPDESVDAPAVSGYFKKRVLIEDYTGTWCGNCTRVAYAIEKVFEQTDKAVAVAIHGGGNDPYKFTGISPLEDLFFPSGIEYPQSRLNRTTTWVSPEPLNVQQAKNLTGNNCGLGLAMNSTIADGNITLDVNIKLAQSYSDLKLVVYLVENNLIHKQSNYTQYFNAVNPILDFEHNHVLRTSLTNVLGDAITESTALGQTITKHFSLPVPTVVENASNISFVAFIVGADNKAINVRASHTDENQAFEEN
jgi:hypothetical protein